MRAGTTRQHQRRKEGALKKNIFCFRTDSAGLATHNTGQRQRPIVISNQHIAFFQLEALAIQQHKRFSGAGTTHVNSTAELAQIKGMQRLTKLQQYIVGDIDQRINRAQAGAAQLLAQPQR